MKYDLICYGEVLYDVYSRERGANENKKVLSGAPLTTASIASKLGLKTGIISAINKKDNEITDKIKSRKVDSFIQKNSKPTGESIIKLNKNKTPNFKIKKDVAYDYIKYSKELKNINPKIFYFGTLAQRNKKSRKTLQKILKDLKENPKKNTKTIYDVNIREGFPWKKIFKSCLSYTDILKVNEYELKEIKKLLNIKSPKKLLNHIDYLFITKGNKGAEVYYKTKKISLPSYKYKVEDTTGCGDSFSAGIVYGMVKNWNPEKILKFALRISGKTSSRIGAYSKEINYR